ncbi:MAG: zinc transport system ATP-binding protein [Acidobacteriota bacterium]|jgi:zinc transport system ATP-binding protein|nr:zinc transport system ATP-binding protein [Acidobacteriota bacterium]
MAEEAEPPQPPLLEVRDLGVRHGREVLLSGVDLTVRRGSIHVVVGPNGAGKSTLLAGILGRTAFTGSIVAHWRGKGRIGYLPQSFAVDRTLPVTVTDFLALARQRRPVCFGVERGTRQRIEGLLARVGLSGLGDRMLSVLSGGELRRVLLANAIDPLPELLLLDEPAAGLDERAIGRMEETLLSLKREAQLTVLMVSHDLGQVRRLADRVTLLNRTVERDGPPAEVLTADLPEALLR